VIGRQPSSKERQSESRSRLGACRGTEQWQAGNQAARRGSQKAAADWELAEAVSQAARSSLSAITGNKKAQICSSTGDVVRHAAGEVTKQWQDTEADSQAAELRVGQGEAARRGSLLAGKGNKDSQSVSQQVGRQVPGTGSRDRQQGQPVC